MFSLKNLRVTPLRRTGWRTFYHSRGRRRPFPAGEVVDHVLHTGGVGVALGRDAELPAHVVVFAEPAGSFDGGVVEARGKEAALLVQRVAKPEGAGGKLRVGS